MKSRDPEHGEKLEVVLKKLAPKYLWWQNAEVSLRFPERAIAQIMELGDYGDIQELIRCAGEDVLKKTIQTAQAGWFSPKPWHFWHYKLGLCGPDEVPPLPQRFIP